MRIPTIAATDSISQRRQLFVIETLPCLLWDGDGALVDTTSLIAAPLDFICDTPNSSVTGHLAMLPQPSFLLSALTTRLHR